MTLTSTLTTASILKPTGSGLASSAKKPEVSLDQFDFASQKGWDDFYQQLDASTSISTATPTTTTTTTTTTNIHTPPADVDSSSGVFEFDWHASIPHETILSEIKPLASSSVPCKVLFVGTGNSILPRRLYDEYRYSRDDDDDGDGGGGGGSDNDQMSITCMDYSQPSIDILRSLHQMDCPGMNFVCGDVNTLVRDLEQGGVECVRIRDCDDSDSGDGRGKGELQRECGIFDYVVDKGLMDALMCGEGWDSDIDSATYTGTDTDTGSASGGGGRGVLQYFKEAKRVLKPGGTLILVSYKLSQATKEYLQRVGAHVGIQWTLDIEEKSNGRVSFSLGRCLEEVG